MVDDGQKVLDPAAALQIQLQRVPLQTKRSQSLLRSAKNTTAATATNNNPEPNVHISSPSSPCTKNNEQHSDTLHFPSKDLLAFASTTSIRTQINKPPCENDVLLQKPGVAPQRFTATSPFYNSLTPSDTLTHSPLKKRNFYDDFTSVDWVKDYLVDINCQQENNKSLTRFLLYRFTDWFVLSLVCIFWAVIAYTIDKFEELLIDVKRGVCTSNVLLNQQQCLSKDYQWKLWPAIFEKTFTINENHSTIIDFIFYVLLSVVFAYVSVKITMTTKSENPLIAKNLRTHHQKSPPKAMYTAYGSGVPEVKTVLSGFTIRRFLGSYTLFAKSLALVFAIASGLSLGKEGPYVHLATCCGNICSRFFEKYRENGIEKRVLLSASAAAGVALAFGSPLGGVLFSIEEISYYLPGNQLFKTFFTATVSTLLLKYLNPYGTGKAVLFEVTYESDWVSYEIPLFAIIGVAGGISGAAFCKFVGFWSKWFRSKKFVSNKPVREVFLVTVITALLTFSNPYTNISVSNLLANIASPCYSQKDSTGDTGLCPLNNHNFMGEFQPLLYALIIKMALTSVTFGLKVPAGIYVPSMIIGALGGRLFGTLVQFFSHYNRNMFPFNSICSKSGSSDGVCVDVGIYAMIGAAASMAGVTRMNVTLAVIMFELTSSYAHVLPISIAIASANFVANLIEPKSLYESLIVKNDFPYLDKRNPHLIKKEHQQDLKYIMTSLKENKKSNFYIDVTDTYYASSHELHDLLERQQRRGLVDGSIPILKRGKLVGLLPGPELQLSLDKASKFKQEYRLDSDIQMKLFPDNFDTIGLNEPRGNNLSDIADLFSGISAEESQIAEELLLVHMLNKISDLTHIVETAPIILALTSPLSLVELVFTNLGNRCIVIMDEGQFVGFLHKKDFIDYCRDFET